MLLMLGAPRNILNIVKKIKERNKYAVQVLNMSLSDIETRFIDSLIIRSNRVIDAQLKSDIFMKCDSYNLSKFDLLDFAEGNAISPPTMDFFMAMFNWRENEIYKRHTLFNRAKNNFRQKACSLFFSASMMAEMTGVEGEAAWQTYNKAELLDSFGLSITNIQCKACNYCKVFSPIRLSNGVWVVLMGHFGSGLVEYVFLPVNGDSAVAPTATLIPTDPLSQPSFNYLAEITAASKRLFDVMVYMVHAWSDAVRVIDGGVARTVLVYEEIVPVPAQLYIVTNQEFLTVDRLAMSTLNSWPPGWTNDVTSFKHLVLPLTPPAAAPTQWKLADSGIVAISSLFYLSQSCPVYILSDMLPTVRKNITHWVTKGKIPV